MRPSGADEIAAAPPAPPRRPSPRPTLPPSARQPPASSSRECMLTTSVAIAFLGAVADDLSEALGAITRRAELLIASLDPSGPSLQHAQQIRRVALRAARLT